jgi:hypothetical protein
VTPDERVGFPPRPSARNRDPQTTIVLDAKQISPGTAVANVIDRCEGADAGRCEGTDAGRCEGADAGRCERKNELHALQNTAKRCGATPACGGGPDVLFL